MEINVETPKDFSFKRTVLSHGWYSLLPFELDESRWTLVRVLETNRGRPVTVTVTGARGRLSIRTARPLSEDATRKVKRDVRHMLRLDDEMSEFYGAVRDEPEFAWIAREGAGRLLRSPTVFEDLVKSLCTTNCSWALTEKMVTGLVKGLGREAADGRRSFPTPEAMAHAPESFYRQEVRAGYRAPYLKELAERVSAGELDVESWLGSELPTEELRREMKRVKGIGDYAAENLLKLVGRYDCLALDSWVRAKFARTRGGARLASDDAKIARYYSRFRSWRGLALWCDMTRDWLPEE
jgi:3-methyladenine DNA glycosylase/8-oxoguanine DNA glycosylase